MNGSAPVKRHRNRFLTPAQRGEIAAKYANGMPVKDIAADYNVHWTTVYRTVAAPAKPTPVVPDRPVRRPNETKHQYANRVQSWIRATNPEWDAAWRAKMSAGVKKSWRKRKAAKARAAELDARLELHNAVAELPEPVFTPPTLWQRIVGWFR